MVGSNTNDDMKYVRNNLYGYGYREEQYLAPTKNMNDIEEDINDIIDVNEEQSDQIQELFQSILDIMTKYLSRDVADELYGANLSYDEITGELTLLNADGRAIGEPVIIHSGSGGIAIKSIELVHEGEHGEQGLFLKFTYETKDEEGHVQEVSIYVDVNELKDIYTAGNGIEISDAGEVSVKIPENDYISVDENGISTSGLNSVITDINEKISAVNAGEGLVVTNQGEAAFGNYNVSTVGETLFSIGNGTSDAERSNALEVKADGTVWMNIEGEYMPINQLLGMLAHETYDN